jgi:hypothetical protein
MLSAKRSTRRSVASENTPDREGLAKGNDSESRRTDARPTLGQRGTKKHQAARQATMHSL